MARDILMPQMGYDMTEGTLVRWVKKVGDKVRRGDVVAEIETDKATVEIEAFENGTLLRVLADPGQTLPVGSPIATLGEAGEELAAPASPAPAAPDAPAAAPTAPAVPTTPAAAAKPEAPPRPTPGPRRHPAAKDAPPPRLAPPERTDNGERPRSSPLARRLAQELGVDLVGLQGSGPGGRILAADVEAADASQSAPAEASTGTSAPPSRPPLPEGATDVEMSRLRVAIARRMGESKRTTPHFYVAVDCRADALLRLRQDLAAKGTRVSVNDILVKALATAAERHPAVNVAYVEGATRTFSRVDVGIAVATDQGLLSPAITGVGVMSLEEIAAATRDLAERARAGRLRPEEYGGGTITLSNLGMYGVDEFLAIINPPQALIVSVGAAAERVVPVKGKPGVARVMTAWAAADHRVLDGAVVGEFMATFRSLVEEPAQLAG